MQLRPAHNEFEVLAVFEALGGTLESLLDELAHNHDERDDRPRQYALAVQRWARGHVDTRALGAAARALAKKGSPRVREGDADGPVWSSVCHATNAIASWRADCMRHPTHTPRAVARVLALLAQVLVAQGEAPEAALARVRGSYATRFEGRTGKKPSLETPEPRRSRFSD